MRKVTVATITTKGERRLATGKTLQLAGESSAAQIVQLRLRY